MKIISTVIDCDDENQLADFYAELLGWTKTFSSNNFAILSHKDSPSLLAFQHVDNYQKPVFPPRNEKQARMVHFDIYSQST